MIRTSTLWAALSIAVSTSALAQNGADPRFESPDLPEPNEYRTADGRPGPEYWQQRADYRIEATLDPAANRVGGTVTITYGNNSPHPLPYLWVHLEQNLFADGSRGAQAFPAEGRFGGGGFAGGCEITRVEGPTGPLTYRIDDARMRIELDEALASGASTEITIDWAFHVPETGADRMGHDGDLYLLAQWYPRVAVYDDIRGWNAQPYLGQGEFYLEYGDYDVALTVPSTYFVGATGSLTNPGEVLTAEQLRRIDEARAGELVEIVTETELADVTALRPRTDGNLTWRFRAEDVRDFAWAASPRFVWDATSYGDTMVHALYRPDARTWREAARMTRHSIEFYSEYLGEYPYPTATSIEGPVSGMEYPMVVFVAPEGDREALFDVLDHEWGHMWFPMIVGSDEKRFAWMDEGLDTFINQLSKRVYFPDSEPELLTMATYATAIRTYDEQPIGLPADAFDPGTSSLGVGAYIKPAVMLNALRAYVGSEPFDAALREYVEHWSFKHPQPADLFRLFENELGEDLGWFWYNWIYTTGTNDMAILGVDQSRRGEVWKVTVSIDQRGDLLMPALVEAKTDGGDVDRVVIPVEAFYGTDRAAAVLTLPDRATVIAVNGGPEWGDVNPQNNTWER